MSENMQFNEAIELSNQELDTVAGGALKASEGSTKQRTEEVSGSIRIGHRQLESTSFVFDDQFEAELEELIVTGNQNPTVTEG